MKSDRPKSWIKGLNRVTSNSHLFNTNLQVVKHENHEMWPQLDHSHLNSLTMRLLWDFWKLPLVLPSERSKITVLQSILSLYPGKRSDDFTNLTGGGKECFCFYQAIPCWVANVGGSALHNLEIVDIIHRFSTNTRSLSHHFNNLFSTSLFVTQRS